MCVRKGGSPTDDFTTKLKPRPKVSMASVDG